MIFFLSISLLLLDVQVFSDHSSRDDDLLRGLPCRLSNHQLKCSDRGQSYPVEAITEYVEDNKALLRRMFGVTGTRETPRTIKKTTIKIVRTFGPEKVVSSSLVENRFPRASRSRTFQRYRRDVLEGTFEELVVTENQEDDFYSNHTNIAVVKRQAEFPGNEDSNLDKSKTDVCESKLEVETPFWAVNSDGKLRAILNNKEFEQAVHQEICTKSSTFRCSRDCSCEQKYKWHRLLAYDPNNDCAGIFMDWFLFPACCSCRCRKNPFLGK